LVSFDVEGFEKFGVLGGEKWWPREEKEEGERRPRGRRREKNVIF